MNTKDNNKSLNNINTDFEERTTFLGAYISPSEWDGHNWIVININAESKQDLNIALNFKVEKLINNRKFVSYYSEYINYFPTEYLNNYKDYIVIFDDKEFLKFNNILKDLDIKKHIKYDENFFNYEDIVRVLNKFTNKAVVKRMKLMDWG